MKEMKTLTIGDSIYEIVDDKARKSIIKGCVTPQMYGAYGDGIHDDTEALNACLHSNNYVFIPKGFYRITSTVTAYCRDILTVECDNKAIFIADGVTDYMFKFSEYVGYSHIGVRWNGGIFNCSGIEGLTGILVNSYSSFGYYNNITVIDVGNNGTGIECNITSGKNNFDNILIFGATFNIDITNPKTNVSVKKYDLTRTNIGFKSINSWDYSIGTIYVMGCTIGIKSSGSAQVDVKQYHYWIGTDGESNPIPTSQYIKTRGFISDKSGDNWHFNLFYPDKPYIGFEGMMVTCDNVHYITMLKTALSDYDSLVNDCYLAKLTDEYGVLKFENLDVAYNPDTRVQFKGISGGTNRTYIRNGIRCNWLYASYFNYIHNSLMINNGDYAQMVKVKKGEKTLIGYVGVSVQSHLTLDFSSYGNALAGSCEITCKSYNGEIRNAACYKGNQSFDWKISLTPIQTINGTNVMGVVVENNYTGTTPEFEISIKPSGMLPYIPVSPIAYTGSLTITKPFLNEYDTGIKIIQVKSDAVNITSGVGIYPINPPSIPEGYTLVENVCIDGYVDRSNACIINLYHSSDNMVSVYNTESNTVKNATIVVYAMCTARK